MCTYSITQPFIASVLSVMPRAFAKNMRTKMDIRINPFCCKIPLFLKHMTVFMEAEQRIYFSYSYFTK